MAHSVARAASADRHPHAGALQRNAMAVERPQRGSEIDPQELANTWSNFAKKQNFVVYGEKMDDSPVHSAEIVPQRALLHATLDVLKGSHSVTKK